MTKEGLVAGVYLWINRENGKMYVGSSINLNSRMKQYFSLDRAHGIIGHGLRKYGLNGFVLVLLLFPNATTSLLLALEQSVLDNCVCAYNISPTAESPAGVKRSEETKAKVSAARKGREHSEETKDKISAALKGREFSEEHIAKMSARKQGAGNPRFNQGKPVYLYIIHSHALEQIATYSNRSRLAEFLGIPRSTLYNYIINCTLFKVNGVSYIASYNGNLS